MFLTVFGGGGGGGARRYAPQYPQKFEYRQTQEKLFGYLGEKMPEYSVVFASNVSECV